MATILETYGIERSFPFNGWLERWAAKRQAKKVLQLLNNAHSEKQLARQLSDLGFAEGIARDGKHEWHGEHFKVSYSLPNRPIIRGVAVVWGARDPRPIVNIPPNAMSVRLRLRKDDHGKAYVRFPDRVEQWLLMPADEQTINHPNWKLGRLMAVNIAKPQLAK
jgi:hypothetical protein